MFLIGAIIGAVSVLGIALIGLIVIAAPILDNPQTHI